MCFKMGHGAGCLCNNNGKEKRGEYMVTYKVVRFYCDKESKVIQEGLTLDEAQEHCQRDDTHGKGWFDGYTKE
jgi:hypothetical protein